MEKIKLLGMEIDPAECELLLDYDAAGKVPFEELFQVMAGEWTHDGEYLIGTETGNKGGILFTRDSYADDVMITVEFATALPATRDLNTVWCAHWDEKTDYLGESYVCGLNGWYDGLAGIERNGGNGLYTATSLYNYTPGEFVTLTSGSVNGHCFLVVDDKLVSEVVDPDPITGGHAGISPYCTRLRIRRIQVRKITWKERYQHYDPEF